MLNRGEEKVRVHMNAVPRSVVLRKLVIFVSFWLNSSVWLALILRAQQPYVRKKEKSPEN